MAVLSRASWEPQPPQIMPKPTEPLSVSFLALFNENKNAEI
jgi:hypothetical protein